jgi:hypothetical protein
MVRGPSGCCAATSARPPRAAGRPTRPTCSRPAADDCVSWCADYAAFRAGCAYVGPGYSAGYAAAAPVGVSGERLRFGPVVRTYDVSLHSPPLRAGAGAGEGGRIGARPVGYTRLLYGDDAATARAPGEATGAWWFADASFALTLGFSADGPTVDVSADPAPIGVVKPRNDAACDDVQVRADASFAGGLHAASPDTVYAEIDYAAAAALSLARAPAAPTLLVDDAVFTACVDEHALGPIGSTAELRAELDGMVAREELCGLRGPPVPFTIGCAVAGEAREPIALALTAADLLALGPLIDGPARSSRGRARAPRRPRAPRERVRVRLRERARRAPPRRPRVGRRRRGRRHEEVERVVVVVEERDAVVERDVGVALDRAEAAARVSGASPLPSR